MATKQEQDQHLAMTAPAARKLELSLGLPMELTVGKIALETGWGIHAPGNNFAGIKCKPGNPAGVKRETFEDFDVTELADFRRRGGVVKRSAPSPEGGKTRVWIDDWFLSFPTPADFFVYYGMLMVSGLNFKGRFAKYRSTRNLDQFMAELSGTDGKPKYFTGDGYVNSWRKLVNQTNVKSAIAEARAAT
jgi:hypothetical protein